MAYIKMKEISLGSLLLSHNTQAVCRGLRKILLLL